MGARRQPGPEAIRTARRCDVGPRGLEAGLHGGSGRRKAGSGAIPARSSRGSLQASGRREQVQGDQMSVRLTAPGWGLVPTLVVAMMCATVAPTTAQPRKKGVEPSPAADVKK